MSTVFIAFLKFHTPVYSLPLSLPASHCQANRLSIPSCLSNTWQQGKKYELDFIFSTLMLKILFFKRYHQGSKKTTQRMRENNCTDLRNSLYLECVENIYN
jgi:hypothetical protein